MADDRLDTRKVLALRKLTRAAADLLRGLLLEYLAALAPLLRPKAVLGEFVGPATKETVAGADKTFKELQTQYEALATSKLYGLPRELNPPLSLLNPALELSPLEYAHQAGSGAEAKTVTVVSPFQWIVTYAGFGPRRIRELLSAQGRSGEHLQQSVLHALMLGAVFSRQTGVTRILEMLHFPVKTVRLPEFGDLTLPCIAVSVATLRPPDDIIIESTELSGMNVFEEVVNVEQIVGMSDPLRDRLIELVKTQAPGLLPQ